MDRLPISDTGLGSFPDNQEIGYRGLVVAMKPSTFLKLAPRLPRDRAESVDFLKQHIENGGTIGPMTLYVRLPRGWTGGERIGGEWDYTEPAEVVGHEGRNRAYTLMELYGDNPVPTHLIVKGRPKHRLRPEWIEKMRSGMRGEEDPWSIGLFVDGPLFAGVGAVTPNGRPLPRARASFDRHFDEVENHFPDFGVIELHHDERAGEDNGSGSDRQFGYCTETRPIRIAFASKIETMPQANIDGLMAHEFGHALDHRYGKRELERMLKCRLPDGVERRADAIAEAVFGRIVKYDGADVQCVSCSGASPRPRRLGA